MDPTLLAEECARSQSAGRASEELGRLLLLLGEQVVSGFDLPVYLDKEELACEATAGALMAAMQGNTTNPKRLFNYVSTSAFNAVNRGIRKHRKEVRRQMDLVRDAEAERGGPPPEHIPTEEDGPLFLHGEVEFG
jgi:hypothetical protein